MSDYSLILFANATEITFRTFLYQHCCNRKQEVRKYAQYKPTVLYERRDSCDNSMKLKKIIT